MVRSAGPFARFLPSPLLRSRSGCSSRHSVFCFQTAAVFAPSASPGAYSGSTGKIVGDGKWVVVAVGGLSGGVVGAVGAGLSSEMAPAFADSCIELRGLRLKTHYL